MKQLSIALIAGARPNFMKVAPLFHALSGRKESARKAGIDLRVSIVHTGQHYDPNMSDIFFRELGCSRRRPDRRRPAEDGNLRTGTSPASDAIGKGEICDSAAQRQLTPCITVSNITQRIE